MSSDEWSNNWKSSRCNESVFFFSQLQQSNFPFIIKKEMYAADGCSFVATVTYKHSGWGWQGQPPITLDTAPVAFAAL